MMVYLDSRKLGLDLGILRGEIVGIASQELPIMGRMMIVHSPKIKSESYPYEYFSVPESLLTDQDGFPVYKR